MIWDTNIIKSPQDTWQTGIKKPSHFYLYSKFIFLTIFKLIFNDENFLVLLITKLILLSQ